jgi:hypothetical protein
LGPAELLALVFGILARCWWSPACSWTAGSELSRRQKGELAPDTRHKPMRTTQLL